MFSRRQGSISSRYPPTPKSRYASAMICSVSKVGQGSLIINLLSRYQLEEEEVKGNWCKSCCVRSNLHSFRLRGPLSNYCCFDLSRWHESMNSQGEREDGSTPAESSAPDSGEVGVGAWSLEATSVAPERNDQPVISTRPIPASSSKLFRPLERDATFSHGRLLVPAHPTLDLGHIRKGRFDLPHSQNS